MRPLCCASARRGGCLPAHARTHSHGSCGQFVKTRALLPRRARATHQITSARILDPWSIRGTFVLFQSTLGAQCTDSHWWVCTPAYTRQHTPHCVCVYMWSPTHCLECDLHVTRMIRIVTVTRNKNLSARCSATTSNDK